MNYLKHFNCIIGKTIERYKIFGSLMALIFNDNTYIILDGDDEITVLSEECVTEDDLLRLNIISQKEYRKKILIKNIEKAKSDLTEYETELKNISED